MVTQNDFLIEEIKNLIRTKKIVLAGLNDSAINNRQRGYQYFMPHSILARNKNTKQRRQIAGR